MINHIYLFFYKFGLTNKLTITLRAILIDDEYSSSEILQYEINKIDPTIVILGIYDNPLEGLKVVKKERPDVLFLDIEMPKINGFELLELLEDYSGMQVVFVTAYNKYALKAFRYYAIDYLLKPVDSNLLKATLDKIKTNKRIISKTDLGDISSIVFDNVDLSKRMVIPISNGYEVLNIDEIIRCDADNNYTTITLLDKRSILVCKPLKHFSETLKPNGFIRVHQSHLINPQHIKQYIKSDGGYIVLNDDSIVNVARSMKKEINDLFRTLIN